MFLKILIFAVALGTLYRFFGGKIPFLDKKDEPNEVEKDFGQEIQGTSKCANCGVYMTEEDALIYHRKAYCSNECVEQSKK